MDTAAAMPAGAADPAAAGAAAACCAAPGAAACCAAAVDPAEGGAGGPPYVPRAVLVTGGAGFIGSAVATLLARRHREYKARGRRSIIFIIIGTLQLFIR